MSRVGQQPIIVPPNIEVSVEADKISVKGNKGETSLVLPRELKMVWAGDQVIVSRRRSDKKAKSLHGLYRTLIANMIIGIKDGFSKELELVGTGYRAKKEGSTVVLSVGFSHPVIIDPPVGITLEVKGDQAIQVSGIDKQLVGQIAANIRAIRPPEPYKGKGIRYRGETVKLKPGKQVKSSA